MTWLTTWIAKTAVHSVPQYEAHDNEQAAEAHAQTLIRNGTARHVTWYEIATEETAS